MRDQITMNCDKVLSRGTRVRVVEVEPSDVVRGVKVGDTAVVVDPPGGGFKGMLYNEKKYKVAWAHYFNVNDVVLCLGFHQVEPIAIGK